MTWHILHVPWLLCWRCLTAEPAGSSSQVHAGDSGKDGSMAGPLFPGGPPLFCSLLAEGPLLCWAPYG